jgi:hypothetical protein
MSPSNVHTHGTEDGPGLACKETMIDGRPVGECVLAAPALAPGRSLVDADVIISPAHYTPHEHQPLDLYDTTYEGKTAAEWAEVAESRMAVIENQADTIRQYMNAVRQRDDQLDTERAKERRTAAQLASVRKELAGLRDDYVKVWRSNELRGNRITRLLTNRARLEATISRFLDAASMPTGSFGQRTALQRIVADYIGNKGETVQPIGDATPGVAYEPLAPVTEAP